MIVDTVKAAQDMEKAVDDQPVHYNDFINEIEDEEVLLNVLWTLQDHDHVSLVLDELEKFPVAPPFPPWEEDCDSHNQIILSCPYPSKYRVSRIKSHNFVAI